MIDYWHFGFLFGGFGLLLYILLGSRYVRQEFGAMVVERFLRPLQYFEVCFDLIGSLPPLCVIFFGIVVSGPSKDQQVGRQPGATHQIRAGSLHISTPENHGSNEARRASSPRPVRRNSSGPCSTTLPSLPGRLMLYGGTKPVQLPSLTSIFC